MKQQSLGGRLLALYLPLSAFFREAFSEKEQLSLAQFRVMSMIHYEGTRGVGALSERNLVSQPAMSKMIENLVQIGYIRRRRDPRDKRQIILQVSVQGRTEMAAIHGAIARNLTQRLARLSEKDRSQAVRSLDIILRALGDDIADL